jgi:hypothetical protein
MTDKRERHASPLLQAVKLWERTSGSGKRYFAGRLGGVRVVILENRDRGRDGEPDWLLYFADGTPSSHAAKPQTGGAP